VREGLEIDLFDFDAEDVMQKGDYMWQVFENVIGVEPTVLEVNFMRLFMALGRILLQGSVLMNLFGPLRQPVDLAKVVVGIQLRGNIYLVADITGPGVHFAPVLRQHPSFNICFLVSLSHLHKFCSLDVGFGRHLFGGSPE
jgi:hypothetical protein